MKYLRACCVTGLSGMLLISQSGCLAVAAAAGAGAGVAYVRGDLETTLEATPDQVATAAKAAFEDLKMPVISSEGTAIDGKVVARTAQDKKIEVISKAQGEKLSKVSIRAGTFGDESLQMRVLEKVKEKLK